MINLTINGLPVQVEEGMTLLEVAKFYGATHLIPFDGRPALQPWLNGEREGLELVYDKGLKIYKIKIPH